MSDDYSIKHRIEILPVKAMVDEKVTVLLEGFKPRQKVTVRAWMKDDTGRRWESHATFEACENGKIDLDQEKPLSGTFDLVNPMGLIWSMVLDREEEDRSSLVLKTLKSFVIHFGAEVDGEQVSNTSIERLFMAPGLVRKEVRENGIVGTFFHDPNKPSKPGIITVSGSGGGVQEQPAALLASHGYSVLTLAYFKMEGVPEELVNIPLEYCENAIGWMKSQDTVDPEKLVITGGSRGGELSLLLGATFPDFKVVVARVPSNVVWGGVTRERRSCPSWIFKGKPLPYVFSIFTASDILDLELQGRAGVPYRLTPIFLRAMHDQESMEKAAIPVEKINGPVLLISGQDDQMWPSSIFADLVMKRLEEQGFTHPYEHLCYSGAGHMITYPFLPKTFTVSKHPVTGWSYSHGGTTIDTAFACSDSWIKTLEFLEKHLN